MTRLVEIRRHSMRVIPGAHLSQQGVSLARRVGEHLGTYQRVVTSTLPRAIETAVAMGYAVDAEDELLSSPGEAVEAELPYPQTFVAYAAAVRRGGAATRYAGRLAEFYARLASSLPEQGAALVIHHGAVVELSVVACLPGWDYEPWGGAAGYCEGARLKWEDGAFVEAELLRVA